MAESATVGTDGATARPSGSLRDAALASIVAGITFGLLMQFVMGVMATIGALFTFGQEGLLLGWGTHMVLSLVFALLYAVVTWSRSLADYASAPGPGLVLGAAYGVVLWVVNVGFIWPVWMNAVGVVTLPVPFLLESSALQSFGGHLVWGGVLGAVYPLLR